jgi:hypothetical protein
VPSTSRSVSASSAEVASAYGIVPIGAGTSKAMTSAPSVTSATSPSSVPIAPPPFFSSSDVQGGRSTACLQPNLESCGMQSNPLAYSRLTTPTSYSYSYSGYNRRPIQERVRLKRHRRPRPARHRDGRLPRAEG